MYLERKIYFVKFIILENCDLYKDLIFRFNIKEYLNILFLILIIKI